MGEIVNLRRAAKRRGREAEAQEAAENRIRHGRTKAERLNDARTEAERRKRLDGLKRE